MQKGEALTPVEFTDRLQTLVLKTERKRSEIARKRSRGPAHSHEHVSNAESQSSPSSSSHRHSLLGDLAAQVQDLARAPSVVTDADDDLNHMAAAARDDLSDISSFTDDDHNSARQGNQHFPRVRVPTYLVEPPAGEGEKTDKSDKTSSSNANTTPGYVADVAVEAEKLTNAEKLSRSGLQVYRLDNPDRGKHVAELAQIPAVT